MGNNPDDTSIENPILQLTPTKGLKDYFCPFCNHKLFRGKITRLNMVCNNCNRLVKDTDLSEPDTAPKED